jgi:hypothetical protein
MFMPNKIPLYSYKFELVVVHLSDDFGGPLFGE